MKYKNRGKQGPPCHSCVHESVCELREQWRYAGWGWSDKALCEHYRSPRLSDKPRQPSSGQPSPLDAAYQRPPIRTFDTGATRDTDEGKPDYEGFLSPLVIEAFGKYMHRHRVQSDGQLRDSDNWQRGIPKDVYMKCAWRHFMDWWKEHRGYKSRDGLEDALCGLMFNVMGYLLESSKEGE